MEQSRTSEGEHNLEVLWERVSSMRESMEERRVELLRRLDELNHAHAQAQERNRTYIPRETFDQKVDAMQRAVDLQNSDVRTALDGIRKLLYMGVGIVL